MYLRDAEHPDIIEGLTPIAAMQHQIKHDNSTELLVGKELSNPDPMILAAQRSLSKRDKYYRAGEILYTESGELNIRVSEGQVLRALCIMDALIKILQKRGHSFRFKNNLSYVIIGEEEIEVSLRETSTAIFSGDKWRSRDLQLNGKLELKFNQFSTSTTGKDGKQPLEDQLAKIIARLELMAEGLKVKSEENRIWRLQYEEKERLRKEKAERKKLELQSFKKALQNAGRWQETTMLRNYIRAVENNAIKSGNLNDEINAWIQWARKKADWYDPLIEASDEWLDETDRDKAKDVELPRSDFSLFGDSLEPKTTEKPKWPLLPWYLKTK